VNMLDAWVNAEVPVAMEVASDRKMVPPVIMASTTWGTPPTGNSNNNGGGGGGGGCTVNTMTNPDLTWLFMLFMAGVMYLRNCSISGVFSRKGAE
jgi:hypothetical protein